MKVETFKCDNCETLKKESNHWWKVYPAKKGGLVIVPWAVDIVNSGLMGGIDIAIERHLCGEQCVAQHVSKTVFQPESR